MLGGSARSAERSSPVSTALAAVFPPTSLAEVVIACSVAVVLVVVADIVFRACPLQSENAGCLMNADKENAMETVPLESV